MEKLSKVAIGTLNSTRANCLSRKQICTGYTTTRATNVYFEKRTI